MNEIERKETDLKDVKHAKECVTSAINDLNEVDGLNTAYQKLLEIFDELEQEEINIENEIENLEEEAMFEENDEIWRKEKEVENSEYWEDAI